MITVEQVDKSFSVSALQHSFGHLDDSQNIFKPSKIEDNYTSQVFPSQFYKQEETTKDSFYQTTQSHQPPVSDILKVVMIGDPSVGKTSLIHRLVNDEGPSSRTSPTIGVEFAKMVVWDRAYNISVQLHIWDTAGQERFKSITSHHYKGANAAIIVFDVTERQSLLNAQKWLEEIRNNCSENCQVFLIGNKTDLRQNRDKEVKQQEALNFAKASDINSCYYETSAKWKRNLLVSDRSDLGGIENLMEQMVHQILVVKDKQSKISLEQEYFKGKGLKQLKSGQQSQQSLYVQQSLDKGIKLDKRSLFCDSGEQICGSDKNSSCTTC